MISSAAAGCADGYCITLTGAFPLDAVVDFRIPGQPDVIPNAYSDLSVTATSISLRLNPGVRHDFDVSGLNAWVVNPPLANWSDGYYISAVDKNITGNIDGIALSGLQYYINGWACAKTYEESVDVWIYVGGPAGTGAWLGSGTANLNSEPGVAAACNSVRISLSILSSDSRHDHSEPWWSGDIRAWHFPIRTDQLSHWKLRSLHCSFCGSFCDGLYLRRCSGERAVLSPRLGVRENILRKHRCSFVCRWPCGIGNICDKCDRQSIQ